MRVRKKPVVVEAVEYRADGSFGEMPGWLVAALRDGVMAFNSMDLVIRTLEGEMTASAGDWIIRGVKGELYACKPDVFAMTYEPDEAVA